MSGAAATRCSLMNTMSAGTKDQAAGRPRPRQRPRRYAHILVERVRLARALCSLITAATTAIIIIVSGSGSNSSNCKYSYDGDSGKESSS
jgi:hypothetical protein